MRALQRWRPLPLPLALLVLPPLITVTLAAATRKVLRALPELLAAACERVGGAVKVRRLVSSLLVARGLR